MTVATTRQPAPAADAAAIGALAVSCLRRELAAYPKPGLVSPKNSGSHADMVAATLEAGIGAIGPYFAILARAGAGSAPMPVLRRLGLAAEGAMMRATAGINTHRGAIFGLGLLCAAAGAQGASGDARRSLGEEVRHRWGAAIRRGPSVADSHGHRAQMRYGTGGARAEAAAGFPTIYAVGLPALRRTVLIVPDDPDAVIIGVFFALLAQTEDTNLLHRGGPGGLAFAQATAQRFLAGGGVANPAWRSMAERCHWAFVARGLSPGGCADLLAMTLFVAAQERQ